MQTIELPIMKHLMQNFVLYKWIKPALLPAGFGLMLGMQTINLWEG
jgi:hypothetical protein